jgi:2-methylaconitate cis-trans-isomerase PrpF
MFGIDLPPAETPWRYETKSVDVESQVRKAVLEERHRCLMIVADVATRRSADSAGVISAIIIEIVQGAK